MHVIDAGANIRCYTLLMAYLVGEEGCVYAFEPEPSLYQVLLGNVNTLEVLEQLGMSPQEYFDRLLSLGGGRVWAIEYHEERRTSTPFLSCGKSLFSK
jgi:hypothetical protein